VPPDSLRAILIATWCCSSEALDTRPATVPMVIENFTFVFPPVYVTPPWWRCLRWFRRTALCRTFLCLTSKAPSLAAARGTSILWPTFSSVS